MKERIYQDGELNPDDMDGVDFSNAVDEWEESTYSNARVFEPDFGEEEDEDMEF